MLRSMQEKISFTSTDQHRFDATLYPASDPSAPVLVFFSALGTPAKVYRHIGHAMQQNGVHFCAPDWRGIGSSSVRAGRGHDFGYRELVERDMAAVVAGVRQRFPESPIWLGGHSLGGQLSMLYAAAHPDQIAGVAMIACGSVYMPCYPRKMRWGIAAVVALSRIASAVWGYFPGAQLGFGGREASGVMRDWGHVARTGQYQAHGSSIDYEHLMAAYPHPVLALTFAADDWSPAPAAQALLDKLPQARVSHWCWSAADTAHVPLDHYSWLKHPALVAPKVAQHIVGRSGAR